MFKNKYLIILLVFFIALAGYFAFKWFRGSSAAWKHIPSSAVVVITSEHLQDSTYSATEANLDLKRLPLLDLADDNLSLLSQLHTNTKKLNSTLKEKTITYSYHPRTSTEWGILMYVPIENEEEEKWLTTPQNTSIRVLHHTFQDHKITDIVDAQSRPLFSYLVKDDYLIISYFGDLIEDVVRSSSLNIQSFRLRSEFSKIQDSDYGTSVYLKAEAWKSVISTENISVTFREFANNFPRFQDLHIEKKLEKNSLHLKSTGSDAPDFYLTDLLMDNAGFPFTGHKHISQQTSYFYRFAAKNKESFKKKYLKWHKKNQSEAWEKVKYYVGNESDLLPDNTGSELILCQLEENNSISDGKLVLAEFANYDKVRPTLQKLAKLSNKQLNVSLDKYQGYDIYAISIPELPSALYGSMFSGFASSYVTYVAPYLVISNNSQVLQNYIVDYENHITWQQSPEYDSVLATAKSDAQLSMIVNLRKAQSRVKQGGKNYTDLLNKIESAVFQCHYEGDKAIPEITLYPKKRITSAKVLNKTFLNIDIEWPILYDNQLAALQNPLDGSSEILLTDVQHNLLRTTDLKTGKTEVIAKLNGPIRTSSYKVDFLNIGREQRILATDRTVYAIDQDDSLRITTFSKDIPSASPITDLYLIDGGEDGSNRFIIKNAAQELFVWESVSRALRRLSAGTRFEQLQSPVVALNQIGNRGFIATQQNGKIFLLRESGTIKPEYPVDILTRSGSAFTWDQNLSSGQPELVGVTVSGELIRIGLDGKVASRRQLLRPEPACRFKTLYDQNSLDWIVVRSTFSKTAILSKDGTELFEIKDIQPNADIRYHFFSVDNRFITIRSGNYTTVFDMNGRRLGDKAIPSEMPVQLTYQPGYYKLLIFSRSEKKIQVWSIKLR